ncbi:AEC family transporter [Rhodovarius crocodyli]|uniref:AEC family transporter n=1 Tax=Rhodovarius crocodyli TaxID=1979269 RepID=A0A437MGU1_9PROT|nr:AEC family transporter [Rhodovarius crocodyli]RVT96866.1 AEC family transporter [Rhodovarius crocodyli]
MLTAFLAVFPIFALMGAGFMAGRLNWMGPAASAELNRFVIWLGLPALMFLVIAEADWARLWRPGFVAAYALGSCLVMLAVAVWGRRRGQSLTDASLLGLNACYANVGYMGFPLAGNVFGRESLGLVSMTAIITVGLLFALGIIMMEVGRQKAAHPLKLAGRVMASVMRSPMVLSPLAGGLWAALGVPLPAAISSTLHMLAAAASPCALVAMGLFFAEQGRADRAPAAGLPLGAIAIKLFGHPTLVGLLAWGAFGQNLFATGVAVLCAALPTGTGAFMLAGNYRADVRGTSVFILVSTALSVLTLAGLIAGLDAMGLRP